MKKKRIEKIIALALVVVLTAIVTPASLYEPPEEPAHEIEPNGFQGEMLMNPTPTPAPTSTPTPTPTPTQAPTPTPGPTPTPAPIEITITAAGDVTLGGDPRGNSFNNSMRILNNNEGDFGYFFRNFIEIFNKSDITVVNLEGTLTNETAYRDTAFVFRAPPEFAEALTLGNVDVVSLANNHTMDFGQPGLDETRETLDEAGILHFGGRDMAIIEIEGIKVGFFGYLTWHYSTEHANNITASVNALKEEGAQVIVAFFHWGRELDNRPNADQRRLGRHTIDAGAHLVLGAHPHTIQGIEVYNGRNIVYSLGNFSFAGNSYPSSGFDTFVFQQTFTFDQGVMTPDNVTNIIPARITSAPNVNNYQPTPAEGSEAERIMALIEKYNEELNN